MAGTPAPSDDQGVLRVLEQEATRLAIFKILRDGGTRSDAAAAVGVNRSTLLREAKRDAAFASGLCEAEARGKVSLLAIVRKSAKNDWKAAAWILERKWWKEWSKRKPDEVTPGQFVSTVNHVTLAILGAVPKKYHQPILDKISEIMLTSERERAELA